MKELLSNVGAGGGATVAASGPALTSSGGDSAIPEAKEEKKEEKEEESDEDMVRSAASGFDPLFIVLSGLWSFRLITHCHFRFLFLCIHYTSCPKILLCEIGFHLHEGCEKFWP